MKARAPRPAGGPLALLAALLLALLAAGCRRAEGQAPITLDFWAIGREGEVVQQLLPEFERRNPGVRVRVQQIPFTAAHEKLLTAFVGDATPDLAQMGNTWVPEFAALGAIAPLDAHLGPGTPSGSGIRASDYFPGVWDSNVVEGALYGIPWYVDTRLIFYRSDLLAQAGVAEAPRTWEAWLAAMERVRSASGGKRHGILVPIDEWFQPVMLAKALGAGLFRDHDTRGDFRDPRFRKALAFYVGLFSRGFAPLLGNTQIANVYQQFGEGEFAMYITGPWNIGEFKRRLPPALQGTWMTAPMPAPAVGEAWPGVSLAGGASLVLFRRSPHPEQALRLIAYLSEPAQQKAFFELSGDLPPRFSTWEDPVLARDPYARAFRQQLERAVPTPKVPEWDRVTAKITQHAETVLRGAATLDQALEALDRDTDLILEKRRWLLQRSGKRP